MRYTNGPDDVSGVWSRWIVPRRDRDVDAVSRRASGCAATPADIVNPAQSRFTRPPTFPCRLFARAPVKRRSRPRYASCRRNGTPRNGALRPGGDVTIFGRRARASPERTARHMRNSMRVDVMTRRHHRAGSARGPHSRAGRVRARTCSRRMSIVPQSSTALSRVAAPCPSSRRRRDADAMRERGRSVPAPVRSATTMRAPSRRGPSAIARPIPARTVTIRTCPSSAPIRTCAFMQRRELGGVRRIRLLACGSGLDSSREGLSMRKSLWSFARRSSLSA